MSTMTTKHTFPATTHRPETAKKWLQRQLRKTASRQALKTSGCTDDMQEQASTIRPRTAPSNDAAATDTVVARCTPSIPIVVECASPSPQPPSRPARPNSTVVRDVNAWLDASTCTPSPPLMGGLSYWRAASGPDVTDSSLVQHAVPLPCTDKSRRLSTPGSRPAKSFRCRAKKIHVQMPALLRNKSQRLPSRKQNTGCSASVPLLAIVYQETSPGTPPILLSRSSSSLRPATASIPLQANQFHSLTTQEASEHSSQHRRILATPRTGESESALERRIHPLFARPARSVDSTRPSTAAAGVHRENSMGDLSDAPTYFSGPPPPSYRSRAASVLTTSSFGCIDGMNPAQREMSRQRAAMRRGVRGKLKDFARNFAM